MLLIILSNISFLEKKLEIAKNWTLDMCVLESNTPFFLKRYFRLRLAAKITSQNYFCSFWVSKHKK